MSFVSEVNLYVFHFSAPYRAVYLLGMIENIDDQALPDNDPLVEVLMSLIDIPCFEKPSTKLIRSAEMSANAALGVTLVTEHRSDLGQVRTH